MCNRSVRTCSKVHSKGTNIGDPKQTCRREAASRNCIRRETNSAAHQHIAQLCREKKGSNLQQGTFHVINTYVYIQIYIFIINIFNDIYYEYIYIYYEYIYIFIYIYIYRYICKIPETNTSTWHESTQLCRLWGQTLWGPSQNLSKETKTDNLNLQ